MPDRAGSRIASSDRAAASGGADFAARYKKIARASALSTRGKIGGDRASLGRLDRRGTMKSLRRKKLIACPPMWLIYQYITFKLIES